jgi:hypothetical protein
MKQLIILSLAVFCSLQAWSQHEGTLTKSDVTIGGCTYSSISVKYKVGHFFGEPTVNGAYKVSGSSDCTLPYSTVIWLKITHPSGGYGYIKLDPTVPKVNSGYGYNFTGSPNWDEFICGYNGTKKGRCFSESDAKKLYKEGSISSFVVAW